MGVVTVGRSDYGIYLPILKAIQSGPDLDLRLIVSGAHLSPEFGSTIRSLEADGFPIAERVEMLLSSDSPEGVAMSAGLGVMGFAQAFGRFTPDVLLVLGDRFEMQAAVVAALPFNIPVAHIHGGESTEGAIDEQVRHSITKMSHLHFVSTERYAQRVIQMGEDPWRVTVSGAPGLDNIRAITPSSREELEGQLGLDLSSPTLLATYHPVTLEYADTSEHMREFLAALVEIGHNVVITYPNADTSSREVINQIHQVSSQHPQIRFHANLGTQRYFSLMRMAAAMVGNSSSGIIEAASFELPVVNIGSRQRGRIRGRNVIDVGYSRSEILGGLEAALSPEFKRGLYGLANPYGDGHAAERIVGKLKCAELGRSLIMKRFYDPLEPEGADAPALTRGVAV